MAKLSLNTSKLGMVKKTLDAAAPTGNPSMGQKATLKAGKHLPGMPGSGKMANLKEAIVKGEKEGELKISTVKLPAVVQIGEHSFDRNSVVDVLKKVKSTYGPQSRELQAILSAVGGSAGPSGDLIGFTGRDYKKPDLRKDAGKSYTDTAQVVLGNIPGVQRQTKVLPAGGNVKEMEKNTDDIALRLLNKHGAVPARSLASDKEGVQRSFSTTANK